MTAVDLPIRYHEANVQMAAFPASSRKLALLTPDELRVVELWPGRAPVGIVCFDYVESTVGSYGEVGIVWPVIPRDAFLGRAGATLLPLLFEGRWPHLGWWVHRLPVTTDLAVRAGRELWGYPKKRVDIAFAWNGSVRTCTVTDEGELVLRLSIDTRRPAFPRRFTMRTYTVLGGELLRTRIHVDAVGIRRLGGAGAELTLGSHEWAQELQAMDLRAARPLHVGWFPTWRAILPAAEMRTPLAHGGVHSEPARGAA